MYFWVSLGLLVLLLAGAIFMILKLFRLYFGGVSVSRTAKAIRRYLDRDQTKGVRICIRKTYYYDEILPEEEAGMPEICVVCREYGHKEHEDMRPPLVVISGSQIPLCTSHKGFVKKFVKNIEESVFSVKNGEGDIPSV